MKSSWVWRLHRSWVRTDRGQMQVYQFFVPFQLTMFVFLLKIYGKCSLSEMGCVHVMKDLL